MTAEQRFWRKVNKDGPVPSHRPELGPCWVWTGCTDTRGYGKISVGGGKTTIPAHRFSFELANGPIASGLIVLHACDRPRCQRPSHLSLGTDADNLRDMRTKGRSNTHHKFTDEQVREIRSRNTQGESQCSLGRAFHVVQPVIHAIVHRKSYKHVD